MINHNEQKNAIEYLYTEIVFKSVISFFFSEEPMIFDRCEFQQ